MTFLQRVIPQPVLSLAITALWMALAPSLSLGNFILGAALGLLIPLMTSEFWPDRPRIARPLAGIRLIAVVLYDIVVANWQVARLVTGPIRRIHPAFVIVPIDIHDPFVATILGSIVSLTPGTVTVEIDTQGASLNVHALNVEDAQQLIAAIKTRYEAPLKEIFAC